MLKLQRIVDIYIFFPLPRTPLPLQINIGSDGMHEFIQQQQQKQQ